MHGLAGRDGSRRIDWGRTSDDYAAWRPGPPGELFDRLAALGVGLPGQDVLDLGTGVGHVALELARRGARAAGVDVAAGQVEAARRAAAERGLAVDLRVARAEATTFGDDAFDVVTACQCWLYFELEAAAREVRRVLRDGGVLVTCHFCWLPREDALAAASEALVLRHNPGWSAADWSGEVPEVPAWAPGRFDVAHRLVFDVDVPFTCESWRGRMRACRGVGAALSAAEVAAFDGELEALLAARGLERFTVRHRVDAHVLRPHP